MIIVKSIYNFMLCNRSGQGQGQVQNDTTSTFLLWTLVQECDTWRVLDRWFIPLFAFRACTGGGDSKKNIQHLFHNVWRNREIAVTTTDTDLKGENYFGLDQGASIFRNSFQWLSSYCTINCVRIWLKARKKRGRRSWFQFCTIDLCKNLAWGHLFFKFVISIF